MHQPFHHYNSSICSIIFIPFFLCKNIKVIHLVTVVVAVTLEMEILGLRLRRLSGLFVLGLENGPDLDVLSVVC